MSEPNIAQHGAPDQLSDHSYDGIQEYDNPLPGWWVWLFIATIIFSVGYFYVSITTGKLDPIVSYTDAQLMAQKSAGVLNHDAATLMMLSKDPDTLGAGSGIFQTNCVSCHGRDASGVTGPNLTDNNYINVKKIDDIYDVVSKGRNNGAMPPWSMRLGPNEMVQVSAYVASLRGQNKPGLPPQGVVIPPFSATPAPATAPARK